MPDSLVSIVASASIALGVALATLFLARRAGLTDVQREVREERGALVDTLRGRIALVEEENGRLRSDVEYLKRENEQLRAEVQRLEQHILKREFADARD